MVRAGRKAARPIIPSNGNSTGKLRVRIYPPVGSGRVAIFGTGRVRVRVSIIGYGYGYGSGS